MQILALGNCAVILVAIFSATFQATDKAEVPARTLMAVVIGEALVLDGAGRIVIGGPVAGSGGSIGLARFFQ
jgi:hypothetical protein